MEEAHRIVVEKAGHIAAKGRVQYNKKVGTSELKQGDRVLAKNLLEKDRQGKLRSSWENTIHEVVDRKDPSNSVYTVTPLHIIICFCHVHIYHMKLEQKMSNADQHLKFLVR